MDDESFEHEIAKLQATNRELAAHRDKLRGKFEADQNRAAYHARLVENNKRMKREIAELEGRPYRDEDDPETDYPDPPEPPDRNA
jgi:hypothetical protein